MVSEVARERNAKWEEQVLLKCRAYQKKLMQPKTGRAISNPPWEKAQEEKKHMEAGRGDK